MQTKEKLYYNDFKPLEAAEVELTDDGEWKCIHADVTVEAPCCTSPDSDGLWSCGCNGMRSVYCNDCNNEHMTDDDVESILDGEY